MEQEFSAKELEVAQILLTLPRLVWEADHRPPCTHNLRWGAKGKRSACGEEPPAAPALPPPLPQPAVAPRAAEKLSKKRGRDRMAVGVLKVEPSVEATGAAAQGSGGPGKRPPSLPRPRKVVRPEDSRVDCQEEAPDAVVAGTPERAATAAAPETSSPETPLEFCPSGEEPDAKAKSIARPPPAKKPRLKHEELSKQVDQLNRTRTELQQEGAEIRNRLQALRERNSQLTHMRKKLEEEADRRRQQPEAFEGLRQRSCLNLLPLGPVLQPVVAALPPDHAKQQQQHYQHARPQHWVNSHVVVGGVAPGFSVQPSPAGIQHWNWVWRSDGDKDCSGASRLPDLNSAAEKDPELETQPWQSYCYYDPQQLQQQQQRRNSPEEHRAARKKRIQMIQRRRNAAGGGRFKDPALR